MHRNANGLCMGWRHLPDRLAEFALVEACRLVLVVKFEEILGILPAHQLSERPGRQRPGERRGSADRAQRLVDMSDPTQNDSTAADKPRPC